MSVYSINTNIGMRLAHENYIKYNIESLFGLTDLLKKGKNKTNVM